MTRKMIILAVVGVLALAPAMASALNLVTCSPSLGIRATAELKPGLDCTVQKNKVQIPSIVLNGCTSNSAAPWNTWSAGGLNSKISAADAALIGSVSLAIKAQAFGTCNFSGGPDTFTASGSGKFAFLDASGSIKVKGGKGAFFGTISADISTLSVVATGLVTKGFGAGASIIARLALELGGSSDCGGGSGSCFSVMAGCNIGTLCPPPVPFPLIFLDLVTDAASTLRIDIQEDVDCVGNGNPFPCCMGAGTGNC